MFSRIHECRWHHKTVYCTMMLTWVSSNVGLMFLQDGLFHDDPFVGNKKSTAGIVSQNRNSVADVGKLIFHRRWLNIHVKSAHPKS